MPDPLLAELGLYKEIERARKIARRYGAAVSAQEQFVFLETKDSAGRNILARIDCTGYPNQPLNAEFLDPQKGPEADAQASHNPEHWPKNPRPMERDNRFYLCLAGTKSYLRFHKDPGFVMPLPDLVRTLILWCRGQSHLLRLGPAAGVRAQRGRGG